MEQIYFQIHGYKSGHQLLKGNVVLDEADQDTIDRLSDISGALRPGELFEPYLTCYPLPSGKYFVVAKTWQDHETARAGCVITKSAIVPIESWMVNSTVTSVFTTLRNLSGDRTTGIETFSLSDVYEPIVNNVNVTELVEALFLENRQPTIIFNCTEADRIIVRLYAVFWPELRKQFATCTFSLATRSVNNRPFDLLFAPGSVKAKFSDWSGRRIDISNDKTLARHRWTNQLTKSIFQEPNPALFLGNSELLLPANIQLTESVVRLQLLWSELINKLITERSPMAILGLLDIANSQQFGAVDLFTSLRQYIIDAILCAREQLSTLDAWKFYSSLLQKQRRKVIDREIIQLTRKSCCELAFDNPKIALEFITEFNDGHSSGPALLYAGIGDGLADVGDMSFIDNEKGIKWPFIFLLFIAYSKPFAKVVADESVDHEGLLDLVVDSLGFNNSKLIYKATDNLSRFINSELHTHILSNILIDANESVYKKIVSNIGKATGFSVREFDNLLVEHGARLGLLQTLLSIIVEHSTFSIADELVLEILTKYPNEIEWMLGSSYFNETDKANLLIKILDSNSSTVRVAFASNGDLAANSLQVITRRNVNTKVLGEFVLYAKLTVESVFSTLLSLQAQQLRVINPDALHVFLKKTIPTLHENMLPSAIRVVDGASQLDIERLLDTLMRNSKTASEVAMSLKVLLLSGSRVRRILAHDIDYISVQLKNSLKNISDFDLLDAWILLFREPNVNVKKRDNAATTMLEFAYSTKRFDPTNLLVAAFPIIYQNYANGNPLFNFFPFAFFNDWDKCRTLREDLVERYMASRWSRFGLFKVAFASNLMEEVTAILFDRKGGKKFASQAIDEFYNGNSMNNDAISREFRRLFNL